MGDNPISTKSGALAEERRRTHGEWPETAAIAGELQKVIGRAEGRRERRGENLMSTRQREALGQITFKIARILSGDPNHPDHWDDIAGYALLAKGEST